MCSVFALLSLHLFMYGCNLFMWKITRINYNFIFEFSPVTALKHRDAFLICTTMMTSMIGALVIHLLLRAAGFSAFQVDTIPLILLLVSQISKNIYLNELFVKSLCFIFLNFLLITCTGTIIHLDGIPQYPWLIEIIWRKKINNLRD